MNTRWNKVRSFSYETWCLEVVTILKYKYPCTNWCIYIHVRTTKLPYPNKWFRFIVNTCLCLREMHGMAINLQVLVCYICHYVCSRDCWNYCMGLKSTQTIKFIIEFTIYTVNLHCSKFSFLPAKKWQHSLTSHCTSYAYVMSKATVCQP